MFYKNVASSLLPLDPRQLMHPPRRLASHIAIWAIISRAPCTFSYACLYSKLQKGLSCIGLVDAYALALSHPRLHFRSMPSRDELASKAPQLFIFLIRSQHHEHLSANMSDQSGEPPRKKVRCAAEDGPE